MSMTSSTRRILMPLVWASASRWLRADPTGVHRLGFEQHPEFGHRGGGGPVVTAVHLDPAGGGSIEAGDHPHGGGLSGPVRAEKPSDQSGRTTKLNRSTACVLP